MTRAAWPALTDGRAPGVADLALALQRPASEVRDIVAEMVDLGTATAADGQLTGAGGLSLEETENQFTRLPHRLYAWCALDTLGIAGVNRWTTTVQAGAESGRQVALRFDAGRLVQGQRPLYMQLVAPDTTRSLCACTCTRIRFTAQPSAVDGADIAILPVTRDLAAWATSLWERWVLGQAPESVS